MAQRIALHYFPGDSFLHRWDVRCKFFGLITITITLLKTEALSFTFATGLLLCLLILARLPMRQSLRDFWTWVIFLIILLLFQAFFTPGRRVSWWPWLPISEEGLRLGAFTCWRLGLILGYAILFTAVTRPRELQDALIWLLKPFPFLPGRRIGLMVSLTLRFFSLILDQAEEVRLAVKARLGDRSKNPLRRAKAISLPVLRRSLSRAEDVTYALAARGYRDDIPLRLPKLPLSHLVPLFVFLGLSFVVWWL